MRGPSPDSGRPAHLGHPNNPSSNDPRYARGARLLRLCRILLGFTFAALGILLIVTVVMVRNRDAHSVEPAEQYAADRSADTPPHQPVPSSKESTPEQASLSLEDASGQHHRIAHADEVDRVLGASLKPSPADDLLRNEPPPPLPEPPRPRPAAQPVPPPQVVNAPKKDERPAVASIDAAVEKRLQASEEEARQQLLAVPELRLLSDINIQNYRQLESNDARARQVSQANLDYAYNLKLNLVLRQAGGTAGLPLQSGPGCQLDFTTASIVQTLSKDLRDMGFVSVPGTPARVRFGSGKVVNVAGTTNAAGSPKEKIEAFKEWCDVNQVEKFRGALPTLLQMLQVEDVPTRLLLVRELARVPSPAATAALAKRGVVDLSPDVRQAAVAALQKRPANQYAPVLLNALRYPWAPIADRAALALQTLKPLDVVPKLVALLDQPDPSVPVLNNITNRFTVRELVRLNHMRNCLLCHAPSANDKDGLVRGLVPTPGKPLPRLYYAGQSGDFVRADVTFLRQDFSVNLPVKAAAPWPDEQRFDFVTRVRPVTDDEMKEVARPRANYPQREAVLYALRGLTAKDAGDSAPKWRDLLGLARDKDADLDQPARESDSSRDQSTPSRAGQAPKLEHIEAAPKDKKPQP